MATFATGPEARLAAKAHSATLARSKESADGERYPPQSHASTRLLSWRKNGPPGPAEAARTHACKACVL
eukprot:14863794-Alexandrium_andersonii.AAC.1